MIGWWKPPTGPMGALTASIASVRLLTWPKGSTPDEILDIDPELIQKSVGRPWPSDAICHLSVETLRG